MSIPMTTFYLPASKPYGLEAVDDASPLVEVPANLAANESNTAHPWYLPEQDERFLRYDVSPGESTSSGSDDDQDTFFAVDDEQATDQQIQLSASSSIYPVSDRLDPFKSLPVSLNRFEEHLITSSTYETFSTGDGIGSQAAKMSTGPEPSVHMITSAGFRITLARSALDRLSKGRFQGETVRKSLESAAFRYKTDAVATIQALSKTSRQPHQTEELLESLIGLEKLEKKVGTGAAPSPHLAQLREVLRSGGGPLNIRSIRLSRLMVHFECLYGTGRQSYVWCEVDFLQSLAGINGFFSSIWMAWRSLTQRYLLVANEMKNILGGDNRHMGPPSLLKDGSVLRSCLSHLADGQQGLRDSDRLELMCQLTSLFMLCGLVIEEQKDPVKLQQHVDHIHNMVNSTHLGETPNERIMWLLQNDSSETNVQRMWAAAEHVWLLKHVSYNVQCIIKEWLLKFLTGQPLERCFKLDAFYFSYVS